MSTEPPIITSKAKLNKVMRESEGLQEHVFKPQNESWVGDWEKCGQDFRFDNHAKALFSCSSCEGDRLKRNVYKINQKKIVLMLLIIGQNKGTYGHGNLDCVTIKNAGVLTNGQ